MKVLYSQLISQNAFIDFYQTPLFETTAVALQPWIEKWSCNAIYFSPQIYCHQIRCMVYRWTLSHPWSRTLICNIRLSLPPGLCGSGDSPGCRLWLEYIHPFCSVYCKRSRWITQRDRVCSVTAKALLRYISQLQYWQLLGKVKFYLLFSSFHLLHVTSEFLIYVYYFSEVIFTKADLSCSRCFVYNPSTSQYIFLFLMQTPLSPIHDCSNLFQR